MLFSQFSWIFLLASVGWTSGQTASPVITTTNVVTLHEDTPTAKSLVDIGCTDGDGTSVVVSGSISPSSLCTNCFIVVPVDVSAGTYTLWFYPSAANLDFNSVANYYVTLTCKDNIDSPTTSVVEVRLIPNSAPYFNAGVTGTVTISSTKTITSGTTLYTVATTDPDSDPVYYTLTTVPKSTSFKIGYTDGIIRAAEDLRKECIDEITWQVAISDGKINNVGPQVLTVTLDGYNQKPDITNLNAGAEWPEDTATGTVLIDINVDDDDLPTLSYTTSPASAQGLFQITGTQLTLKKTLDYETITLRRPLVLVSASDGSCSSPTYTYTVSVTDANEKPVIKPQNSIKQVYEGNITVDPGWTTTDPDFGDTLTYSITTLAPTGSPFTIDPDTGVITSTQDYDVDGAAMTGTVTITVTVTDSGGLTDSTTVVLHIKDANDNAPTFGTGTINQFITVTECASVGTSVGVLAATDADSAFENNNVFSFSKSGGGSEITVTPSGDIILNTAFAAGTSATYTVTATDYGVYPSSLSSLISATVTVTGLPCPTTTTVAVSTTTTTSTTTKPTTTTAKPEDFNINDNLWWIILTALCGTAFVGITIWLCVTRVMPFCALPGQSGHWSKRTFCRCDGDMCKTRKVHKPHRTRTIDVRPRQQAIEGNAPKNGNDGFWKEHFRDDTDFIDMPDRNNVPEPADYERGAGRVEQKALPAPEQAKVWNDIF